jgi:uncharacterized protein YjdB
MRVTPMFAPSHSRRIAAAVLAASTMLTLGGCKDLIVRTRETESISLAPTNFEVPVNSSVRVVGTAFDKNGASIASKKLNYSSANTSIATITGEGLVIGVSPGQTIIAATADDARGETTVTVIPEAPASILVTPSPVTLRRGNVRQFTATPRNSAGTPISGLTVTWQSSNSAIVSISPQGEASAVAPGNVVITASVNQVSGSAQVTVTEIPIGSISVAPTNKTIQVNETFIPDVTLRDTANNVLQSLGRALDWSSNNELNASVSNSGVVTGRRVGPARITVSSPANPAINAFLDVNVVERTVKTVVISPRTGFLRLAVPRQLSAQLLDSLNQTVTGRVVQWQSLTPTIASIGPNGTINPLALGTARLRASIDDAADTVQFTVTRIPVGEVTVTPPQASVVQGKSITLSAVVKDSIGNEVTDRTLTWLTSNPTTASVNNGVVTGIATGSATITASAENRSDNATVTVLPISVDSILVANTSDTSVVINDSLPNNRKLVQLELVDSDGATVLNRNLLISSNNPDVANATWNQGSRILTIQSTAVGKVGEAVISVRALNANGNPEGKTTRIRVTVLDTP